MALAFKLTTLAEVAACWGGDGRLMDCCLCRTGDGVSTELGKKEGKKPHPWTGLLDVTPSGGGMESSHQSCKNLKRIDVNTTELK